ncbi:MAG: hypothetical protein WCH99_12845 [Verrucomicrobiota bacterium]
MSQNCKGGNALGQMLLLPCVTELPVFQRITPAPQTSWEESCGVAHENVPQRFAQRGADMMDVPLCESHGWKAVLAYKAWEGRVSFNGSRAKTTHFLGYEVEVKVTGSANETVDFSPYDNHADPYLGSDGGTKTTEYSMTASASSSNSVDKNTGNPSGNGDFQSEKPKGKWKWKFNSGLSFEGDFGQVDPAEGVHAQGGPEANGSMASLSEWNDPDSARAQNGAVLKQYCAVNAGMVDGVVYLKFGAWNGTLDDWIASGSLDIDQNGEGTSMGTWHYKRKKVLTGSISEDTITLSIVDSSQLDQTYANANNFGYENWKADVKTTTNYEVTIKAKLNTEYGFAEVQQQAMSMLQNWNLADDALYPWVDGGNCALAPYLKLDEAPSGPTFGWVDSSINSTARTGELQGLPRMTAYYAEPYFDEYADVIVFSSECRPSCYGYGAFAPGEVPRTATKWTPGASDTPLLGWWNCRLDGFHAPEEGGIWGWNQGALARKVCFIKEPLPAQNFFGACGDQRSATLLDDTCHPTSDKRWPYAWPICGAVRFKVLGEAGGVVTIQTEKATALATGDKVTFIFADETETQADIAVTVYSSTEFSYNGPLPTGTHVKSAGASGVWFADTSSKGDFVWKIGTGTINGNDNSSSVTQGNVRPCPCTTNYRAIIAILPPASPELSDPRWLPSSTAVKSIQPVDEMGKYWKCQVNQSMTDRFWTSHQDEMQAGTDGCEPKLDGDGHPTYTIPKVEARLTAPEGAPETFQTFYAQSNQNQMPTDDEFTFSCDGIRGTPSVFDQWPGGTFMI